MNGNCILGLKTSVLVRAYDSGRPLTVSSCDLHSPMFEQGPWDTVWASAAIDMVASFCAVSEAMGGGERKTNGLEVREADEIDEVLVFRLWRGLGGVVRCLGVGLKPPADADRQ